MRRVVRWMWMWRRYYWILSTGVFLSGLRARRVEPGGSVPCIRFISSSQYIRVNITSTRGRGVPCIRFISSSALNRRISASTCRDISYTPVRVRVKVSLGSQLGCG